MPEITPDRIRAYLDDLALISAKHGVGLIPSHRGGMAALDLTLDPTFEGYFANRSKESWSVDVSHSFTWSQNAPIEIASLVPATTTAHQRIALERSLANIRRQVVYKSDALEMMHRNAAELHQHGAITDAQMLRFDELCLVSPNTAAPPTAGSDLPTDQQEPAQ